MRLFDLFFFPCTDKIHRCNALQSPSIHHRINQWERTRPGGLPASRITHEPQHDWSLLTTPKPVPYSQWKHIPHSWTRKECHPLWWLMRTTHRGWSSQISNMEFMLTLTTSQSYLPEACWSDSLTSSLEWTGPLLSFHHSTFGPQKRPAHHSAWITWLSARMMAGHFQHDEKQSSTVDSFLNPHIIVSEIFCRKGCSYTHTHTTWIIGMLTQRNNINQGCDN